MYVQQVQQQSCCCDTSSLLQVLWYSQKKSGNRNQFGKLCRRTGNGKTGNWGKLMLAVVSIFEKNDCINDKITPSKNISISCLCRFFRCTCRARATPRWATAALTGWSASTLTPSPTSPARRETSSQCKYIHERRQLIELRQGIYIQYIHMKDCANDQSRILVTDLS